MNSVFQFVKKKKLHWCDIVEMVILRQTGNVIGVGGKYNNFIDQVISLKKKCSLPKIMVSFYSENFMNELIIRISFLVYLYKGKLYHLNKF